MWKPVADRNPMTGFFFFPLFFDFSETEKGRIESINESDTGSTCGTDGLAVWGASAMLILARIATVLPRVLMLYNKDEKRHRFNLGGVCLWKY